MQYGNHIISDAYIERSVLPRVDKYSAVSSDSFGPGGACVVWVGGLNSDGYAQLNVVTLAGVATLVLVHRLLAIYIHGHEAVDGMDVDHLCRNRACINVEHHELTTRSINLRRGLGPQLASERMRRAHGVVPGR